MKARKGITGSLGIAVAASSEAAPRPLKVFILTGRLTAGFGSMWGLDASKPGDKIGPEFTFGLTMDAALAEPVLIAKAAWGGKSLHTDFRPSSAGPYQPSLFQLENYPKQEGHGIPKDFEQWKVQKAKATGVYYRLMMDHVKKVLANQFPTSFRGYNNVYSRNKVGNW